MTEKQPTHNLNSQTKTVSILIGCFSILLIITPNSYAQVQSHISITNPPSNGIVSNGFIVRGTYQSPDINPQITIELAGTNYTASDSNGTFSYGTSIGDGTFNMIVYMFDSKGTHRTSVQFNQVTGHVTTLKWNIIVPYYGEACQRMISMNDYSECPPLKVIMPSDTSNQNISGKFVMKKDGTYFRDKPQVRNHYQFYNDETKKTVCVECLVDMGAGDTVQQVIIEPTGFQFFKHTFTGSTVTNYYTNRTGGPAIPYTSTVNEQSAGLTVFHDWYADDSCNTVTIDYSPERFADAIHYLQSGCTTGAYNATTTTPIPYHPFSYNNPSSSLHYTDYLKSIFHGHSQLHNEKISTGGGLGPGNCQTIKCSYTDPYAKAGYR